MCGSHQGPGIDDSHKRGRIYASNQSQLDQHKTSPVANAGRTIYALICERASAAACAAATELGAGFLIGISSWVQHQISKGSAGFLPGLQHPCLRSLTRVRGFSKAGFFKTLERTNIPQRD